MSVYNYNYNYNYNVCIIIIIMTMVIPLIFSSHDPAQLLSHTFLKFASYVLRVFQSCNSPLRVIHRLGKAFAVESKLLLVHALVRSRLD